MQILEKFGSGIEKTRIRDKHTGSETLDLTGISLCSVYITTLWLTGRGIRMLGSPESSTGYLILLSDGQSYRLEILSVMLVFFTSALLSSNLLTGSSTSPLPFPV
jgi:hypothetical protein